MGTVDPTIEPLPAPLYCPMSTITVTVHLLEEADDPIATCTVSGQGFSQVSDVRDPRRFDPYEAALVATFAEAELRRRSRIVQVGSPKMHGFQRGASRQTVYVFAITPAAWGEPAVRS